MTKVWGGSAMLKNEKNRFEWRALTLLKRPWEVITKLTTFRTCVGFQLVLLGRSKRAVCRSKSVSQSGRSATVTRIPNLSKITKVRFQKWAAKTLTFSRHVSRYLGALQAFSIKKREGKNISNIRCVYLHSRDSLKCLIKPLLPWSGRVCVTTFIRT